MRNFATTTTSSVLTTHLSLSAVSSTVERDQVLQLVGRDVSVKLLERSSEGMKLELPTGRVIVAKGDLPFPEQTELKVRVTTHEGLIRLQTIEANPPSPAMILAPLLHSEASSLLQKLLASNVPEALMPLLKMFADVLPSKEEQLSQTIDNLPLATKQLLTSLLGMKDTDSTQIAKALIEKFEPTVSLQEMSSTAYNKMLITGLQYDNREQRLAFLSNIFSNDIVEYISKYYELVISKQNTSIDNNNYKMVLDSFNKDLATIFESVYIIVTKNLLNTTDKSLSSEKFAQILDVFPRETRNNLANIISGSTDQTIDILARQLSGNSLANVKSLDISFVTNQTDEPDIEQCFQRIIHLLEAQPSPLGQLLASGMTGSGEYDPKIIAEYIIQRMINLCFWQEPASATRTLTSVLTHIFSTLSEKSIANLSIHIIGKQESNIDAVVKAVVDKILTSNIDVFPSTSQKLVDNQIAFSDLQKLPLVLEKLPASVKDAVIQVLINSGHSEAKTPVEYQLQIRTALDAIQYPHLNNTLANPVLNRILALLPNTVRNELLSAIANNATTFETASYTSSGIGSGLEKINVPSINSESLKDIFVKPDGQHLTQALDRMAPAIRRALASAITGYSASETRDLASQLIQQGSNFSDNEGILSKIESTPPHLRQVIALLAQLPIETTPKQIIETIMGGDRGILEAAKALLSYSENSNSSTSNSSPHAVLIGKDGKDPFVALAERLSYLLSVEILSVQNNFSVEDKNSIASWFRSIVDQLILAKTLKRDGPVTKHIANLVESRTASIADKTIGGELSQMSERPVLGEKAETWQTWIKNGIKALGDSALFPNEAIFHSLIAKENVNYFELPIPWMFGKTVEIWVEEDKEKDSKKKKNGLQRVLVALNFTKLGETKIGIESEAKRLSIRIWAERPQPIENELHLIEEELSALGFDAQISLNALAVGQNDGANSIRSIIIGPSLHALG